MGSFWDWKKHPLLKNELMKKSLFSICLLVSVFLVAWEKDNTSGNAASTSNEIRYELTADVPAAYRISTLSGTEL